MKILWSIFSVIILFQLIACQCEDVVPTEPEFADLMVADFSFMDVDCFGSPVVCTTAVTFTIVDAGPFNVEVMMDPDQMMVVNHPVQSLAAGANMEISVVSGEGGNCYDPDCLIRIFVDSDDVIKELREDNNTRIRNFNG